ncbi:MAG TPA: FtsX-like permease family protein [Anaeromyxobacter sp.]|nr:FtsX-like permease family protein [Anaeromyxobacter sp.]
MLATDALIAGRNLFRHTHRSLLLGGALAGVTALLVLVASLTAGIEEAMLVSATTLMTGHVNVGGFFKITSGSAAPLVSDYPKVLEEVLPRVRDLDYVAVRTRGYAKAVSELSSMDIVLSGVEVAKEPAFPRVVRPLEGKLEDLAQPNTILLFQGQADRLKVKVGDVITLSAPTSRGVSNTADVRVAVVARNVGILSAFSAFIEKGTLNQLYGINDTTTGALQIYLKRPQGAAALARDLRAHLAQAGWRVMDPDPEPYWMKLMQRVPSEDWIGQKLDVSTAQDEMGQFTQFISGVRLVSGIVVGVLLVVVLIGIFNTMAIAIRERTREIGTLRAIGMQRRKVLWLFVLETGLLGLAGATGGALGGALLAGLLNLVGISVAESMQFFLMQEKLHFLLQPGWIAWDVLLFTAVTVGAALPPAFRAARLRPVTAMHHIG